MADEIPTWFKILFYVILYFVIFPVCAVVSIILFINVLQFVLKLLNLIA